MNTTTAIAIAIAKNFDERPLDRFVPSWWRLNVIELEWNGMEWREELRYDTKQVIFLRLPVVR